MIKLLACMLMLIDHIGHALFPDIIILRVIGRLSMPLFAYCAARGYFFSVKKGTFKDYRRRMFRFAVLSEIPYYLLFGARLNIGFTWYFALNLLSLWENRQKSKWYYALMILIAAFCFLVPMDYGLYGVAFVLVFYFFTVKTDNAIGTCVAHIVIHGLCFLDGVKQGFSQLLLTLLGLPIIFLLRRWDSKIKVHKFVYYFFYPAHILALYLIQTLLQR